MTRDELIDRYFDWMYQLVVDDRYSKSYRKLFARLHDTDFTYTIRWTATEPKTASTSDIGSVASIPFLTP